MAKVRILLLASLLLAACLPVPSETSQVPRPTIAVSYPDTAAAPTESRSAVLPGQEIAFSDQVLGISFMHPPDWVILQRSPDDPPGVTLHGPSLGQGPEPIIFAITLDIESVTEKSVNLTVDQQLSQVPAELSGGIKRMPFNVGGEPAEQVVGLPAREGALETFVIHGGQLYLVILQPYDESNGSLLPYLDQVRSVYGALLSSFKFLK